MARRKVNFFDEVSTAFAEVADDLKLTGPQERNLVLPVSIYRGAGVEYAIWLDSQEGRVGCDSKMYL